jgi:hypothetical protein
MIMGSKAATGGMCMLIVRILHVFSKFLVIGNSLIHLNGGASRVSTF